MGVGLEISTNDVEETKHLKTETEGYDLYIEHIVSAVGNNR